MNWFLESYEEIIHISSNFRSLFYIIKSTLATQAVVLLVKNGRIKES